MPKSHKKSRLWKNNRNENKQKINLTELKVTSFVTDMEEAKGDIKGGATIGHGCSHIGCTASYKPFCAPTSPSLCTCDWRACQQTKMMCTAPIDY